MDRQGLDTKTIWPNPEMRFLVGLLLGGLKQQETVKKITKKGSTYVD